MPTRPTISAMARNRLSGMWSWPNISRKVKNEPMLQIAASRHGRHIRRSDVMTSIASMMMTAKKGRHCWSKGKVPKKIRRAFSRISAQQAPPPRHSEPVEAVKLAVNTAHSRNHDRIQAMATISTIVVRALPQLENRCLRAQPKGPLSSTGGASCLRSPTGMSVMAQRSLKAMRLLYQFMNAEIDRLTDR